MRLCRQFFGEKAIGSEAVKQLAKDLHDRDLDIGWAVGRILRSRLFFADANLSTRVLSPVEFTAGAVRALELFNPAPSTLALADWSARMGQDLFEPPNVGGWPGGRAWIHTRGLVARANYAAALISGPSAGRPLVYNPAELPKKYGFGTDRNAILAFHHRLIFGTGPPADTRRRLDGIEASKIVFALLSSSEAQLG